MGFYKSYLKKQGTRKMLISKSDGITLEMALRVSKKRKNHYSYTASFLHVWPFPGTQAEQNEIINELSQKIMVPKTQQIIKELRKKQYDFFWTADGDQLAFDIFDGDIDFAYRIFQKYIHCYTRD